MPIRWRADIDKHVVVSNFERRGWEQASSFDDDWDMYWCSVGTIKQIFGVEGAKRLQPGQLVNHYPNHYELTRKVTIAVTNPCGSLTTTHIQTRQAGYKTLCSANVAVLTGRKDSPSRV